MKKFLLALSLLIGSTVCLQAQTRTFPFFNGPVTPGDCVQLDPTATITDPALSDALAPCGAGGGGSGNVSTTPGAGVNQNVVQPVNTQFSVNNFAGIRYVTPSYNFSQIVATNLATPGPQTVTLVPCPLGIDTSANALFPFSVYIPTINPEVAKLTGGSCASGGTSGTITFTTTLVHSASSNTIQSAYTGIQEAINDAAGSGAANPNVHIVIPPTGANANAYQIRASIYLKSNRMMLEGDGALLYCSTRDRCVMLGDLVNSNDVGAVHIKGIRFSSLITQDGCLVTATQRISNVVTITVGTCSTIQTGDTININFTDNVNYWGSFGPVTVSGNNITYAQTGVDLPSQTTPGTVAILNAAIEDNAFPGIMEDIKYSTVAGGKFNQFFVIDNDQAATIRNFDPQSQNVLCTANHCGSFIYSSGDSGHTPVLWLDKLNLSAQCGNNGITNYANNTTHVTDSVIQGFAMWGINTNTLRGSFGGTQIDNVYNETGNCTGIFHPYYPNSSFAPSSAAINFQGGVSPLTIRGGEQPTGWTPVFLVTNPGAIQYNYFIIVKDANGAIKSQPLYAGYSLTTGSGNITVQWPHVPPQTPGDVVTYDILRMQPSNLSTNLPSVPVMGACLGGSTTACGSVALAQPQCSGLLCSFTDSASANTSSYSLNLSPIWMPILPFWPGGIVLTGIGSSNGSYGTGKAFLDTDSGSANASPWISVVGNLAPSFFVTQCSGSPSGAQFGGGWKVCLSGDSSGNSFNPVGALVLQNGGFSGAPGTGLKGRLNFNGGGSTAVSQSNVITLVDSNAPKTLATPQYRPLNDANDTWIGLDQPTGNNQVTQAQLAFGAPIAISNYIGAQPNSGGTNFLERLASGLKTFNVPIQLNAQLNQLLGTAHCWNSDTGISRDSAGVLDIGNCTPGDKSGTVQVSSIIIGSGPTKFQIGVVAFSALPTCVAGLEGQIASINDSTTNSLGATVTGGGTNHIITYCNGTNWIVVSSPNPIFAAPPPIGNTTANTGSFTALASTSDVMNAEFGSSTSRLRAVCETAGAPTTLSTITTTTDTGLTCLPSNSIIDAVVYRITTTITTAASFTIGDATIAARFCGTQSTLTAGTTGICFLQADQTGTSGPRQTANVSVRITTNANPGAGAIRLIVFYHTWGAPTS